mgnify:CR=1 FL=1
MYDDKCWAAAEAVTLSDGAADTDVIALALRLRSALSIRAYTTELPKTSEDTAPDYKERVLDFLTPGVEE